MIAEETIERIITDMFAPIGVAELAYKVNYNLPCLAYYRQGSGLLIRKRVMYVIQDTLGHVQFKTDKPIQAKIIPAPMWSQLIMWLQNEHMLAVTWNPESIITALQSLLKDEDPT